MITQSATQTHREKLPGDHPAYKATVAEPVMAAVDAMPAEYRRLVHRFGYVDVYRARRRGWSVADILARADGERFSL